MHATQYVLPSFQIWRHPALRGRIVHDALSRGIFLPPSPETVPGALQRLLANENIFDGIDAAALCREQGLRISFSKESLCLLYIDLQKFPALTWKTIMDIGTGLFDEIRLARLGASQISPLEDTPLLVTYNGIWAHQDRKWEQLSTEFSDLEEILGRSAAAGSKINEVCIALSPTLPSGDTDFRALFTSDAPDCLLRGDTLRANLPPLDAAVLTDATRGIWDAYWPPDSRLDPQWYTLVDLPEPVEAANPWEAVRRGSQVAIDFGTSSTVAAVREEDGRLRLLRIGGELRETASPAQYENPTALEFCDYQRLCDAWTHEPWRPHIRWEDIKCSHQARHELTAADRASCGMRSIKTWAREQLGRPPLRLRDEKNHTFELSPLPIAENEGMADVGDVSQRPVDPIELYAYFLGLFLNNQLVYGGVIYPRYYMTFPVKFDRRTRDRILQGFRRGLLRSMPPSLIYGREWRQEAPFRIEEVASEPAAFAAAALPRLGIEPSGDGTAFGVFDFGGGTTDFAFGLYRLATPEESEDEGWENVLDILDVAGDEQLGGEHLLNLAAYEVLRDNTETLLREGIPFLCPHGLSPFTGSELLFTESATAQANMVTLRETLRPLWEEGRLENADTGTSTLNLFTREYKAFAPELKLDEKKLRACLKERIREGVQAFFATFRQAFRTHNLQPERLHILLAGNSCRSPLVQEVFEEVVGAILSEEQRERIVIHRDLLPCTKAGKQPTDGIEDGISELDGESMSEQEVTGANSPAEFDSGLSPTLKTGVAIGLLYVLPGETTGLVERNRRTAESPFLFTVGLFRTDVLHPVLTRNVPYGQWLRLPQKVVRSGVTKLGYSSSPLALEQEIRRRQCREINIEWGSEQFGRRICLRADAPHHVSLALEAPDSSGEGAVQPDETTLRVIELRT